MKKRVVCCTSTGCIEYGPEEYRNIGIEQFHIIVNYNGKDYYEGLDLNPYDFYKTLENLDDPKNNLPHSAIPSYEDIKAKFDDLINKGYEEAIIITISSYLGGTLNAIRLVAEEYKDKIETHLVDSKITCYCESMLAIEAQELVNKGVDTPTILKELDWSIKHQEFIGVCGNLNFLIYNGRLKGGKAFMGKLLKITPVMHFSRDGVLEAFDQEVGLKKGVIKSIEKIKEKIGNRDPKDYYLWHNYTGETSLDPFKEIESEYDIKCNFPDVVASAATGCNTGPYLAGYGLFLKRREDEPLV